MAVNAYASGRLDSLVTRLIDGVASKRGRWDSVIDAWQRSVTLVVPSLEMGSMVEQRMARLAGAAVNVEVQTLQNFTTERIQSVLGDGEDTFDMLEREPIKGLLLRCFRDLGQLPKEARQPIADYLSATEIEGEGDDVRRQVLKQDREARQYQLARELATVFEEYIYSRPDMLGDWEKGEHRFQGGDAPLAASIEVWQAALWRYLRETDHGPTITEAFDEALEAIGDELRKTTTGDVHIFGFAGMGNAWLESLAGLGREGGLDVHFYFYSPVEDPMDMGQEEGHRAMSLWSKVGGDTARQLDDIADQGLQVLDGHPASDAGEDGPLLARLQKAVASNEAGAPEVEAPKGDKSDSKIRFLDCPGVRRELEVVANDIWDRMHGADDTGDDTLRFSDFAVVLPEGRAESYLAHLESVFQSFGQLPHTINSISLSSRTALLDAVEALLSLPLSRFGRSDIVSLLVHPNFMSRFDDVSEQQWTKWISDLNIYYGADREHQSRRGTYLEDNDFYNWEQGMKRMTLGAFMSPEAGDVNIGEFNYRPQEVMLSELPAASALTNAVSSLISDALWLRSKDHPDTDGFSLSTWAEVLEEMVDTYIVPSTDKDADFGAEMQNIARIKSVFSDLAELPDAGPVSYSTALMIARDKLGKLQVGGSQGFTDGVVVSTTGRLRAIPFEHVYLLGAGEGNFPAADPRSELDLRNAEDEPRRGDVQPSARDKYHFLEILQSARSTVTLSWVGRDATTGDDLSPSSIISDIRRMIQFTDRNGDDCPLTIAHPLRRFDLNHYEFPGLPTEPSDRVAINHHPEAREEARMRGARQAMYGDDRPGKTIWTTQALLEAQEELGWRDLRMLPRPEREEETTQERKKFVITLSQLKKFLQTPLQASAKYHLKMYRDESDGQSTDVEPFELDYILRSILFTRCFERALSAGFTHEDDERVARLVEDIFEDFSGAGDLPQGLFTEVVREGIEQSVKNGLHNLKVPTSEEKYSDNFPWAFEVDSGWEKHIWGKGRDSGDESIEKCQMKPLTLEAVEVNGGVVDIEVHGRSQLVSQSQSLVLTPIRGSYYVGSKSHEGFLSMLMLQATETPWGGDRIPILEGDPNLAVVFSPPGKKDWGTRTGDTTFEAHVMRFDLDKLTPEVARKQIRVLVKQYLSICIDLLPASLGDEFSGGELSVTQGEAWVYAIDEDASPWRKIETEYGPVDNYLEYPPPKDPAKVLRERFRYHEKLGLVEPEGEE